MWDIVKSLQTLDNNNNKSWNVLIIEKDKDKGSWKH